MKTYFQITIFVFVSVSGQFAIAQDRLVFTNGKELDVKIEKETSTEIYFVKNTEHDSVRYMVLKAELKQINYMNGDSTVFNNTAKSPGLALIPDEGMGVPNAAYNVWLYNDSHLKYKIRRGFIQNVTDSGMVFSVSSTGNKFLIKKRMSENILAKDIDKIKIRRKGSVGKGMLIGAGAGFFIGGILGLAGIPQYGILSNLSPESNAAAGGVIFSIPGAIIGGIVGSLRIKIPINKNQDEYQKHKAVIASYANTKIR